MEKCSLERREYQVPELQKYGNVAELTRKSSTNSHGDNVNKPADKS